MFQLKGHGTAQQLSNVPNMIAYETRLEDAKLAVLETSTGTKERLSASMLRGRIRLQFRWEYRGSRDI